MTGGEAELWSQLRRAQQDMKVLVQELMQTEQDVTHYKKRCELAEQETAGAKTERDDVKAELAKLQESVENITTDRSNSQAANRVMAKRAEKLEAELEGARSQLQKIVEQNEQSDVQSSELTQTLRDRTTEVDSLKQRLQLRTTEIERLYADRTKLSDEVSAQQVEADRYRTRCESLENEFCMLQAQHDKLSEAKGKLEAAVIEQRREIDQSNSEYESTGSRLAEMISSNAAATEKIAQLQEANRKANEELAARATQIESKTSQIADLQAGLAEWRSNCNAMSEQIAQFKGSVDEDAQRRAGELAELQSTMEEKDAVIRSLEKQVADFERQLSAADETREEQTERIASLQHDLDGKIEEVTALTPKRVGGKTTEERLVEVEDYAEELYAEYQKLFDEKEELKDRLAQEEGMLEKSQKLDLEKENAIGRITELEAKLEGADADKRQMTTQLERLRQWQKDTNNSLVELERQRAATESALKEQRGLVSRHRDELSKLRGENAEMGDLLLEVSAKEDEAGAIRDALEEAQSNNDVLAAELQRSGYILKCLTDKYEHVAAAHVGQSEAAADTRRARQKAGELEDEVRRLRERLTETEAARAQAIHRATDLRQDAQTLGDGLKQAAKVVGADLESLRSVTTEQAKRIHHQSIEINALNGMMAELRAVIRNVTGQLGDDVPSEVRGELMGFTAKAHMHR